MNARHATALALVGWYLIAPPVRTPRNDYPYLDWHAEYHDWKVLCASKSEDDCEAARRAGKKAATHGAVMIFPSGPRDQDFDEAHPGPWVEQQAVAECIASDDPRLKEK